MNYSPRKSLAALACISGMSFALAIQGFAQAKAPAAATDDTVQLEKFVVTGSYIPVAGTITAIPVTILDSKAIENTGITTNLLEVLRKAVPQFTGNANLGNTNGNISSGATAGGSAVAFRNTQTLVLVNGRRVAYAPVLASGGGQFVDLNLIPINAVERVEILQDGASALYGTDAIAGVVNIIMKTDFKGFLVSGRYAFSDNKGKYAQRNFSITGGVGTEKTGFTVSAEWTKTDPLIQFERAFSNPAFGTATFAGVINIGGSFFVLKPSLNAPPDPGTHLPIETLVANGTYIPVNASNLISGVGTERAFSFNLANFPTSLIGFERKAATIAFDHKASGNVSVFGDLLYSQTNTFSQLNAQPFSALYSNTDPRNPTDSSRVRARNRFLDSPRQYFNDTTSIRGVLGVKGTVGDNWRWETGTVRNEIRQQFSNPNLIVTAARIAAVAAGQLNLFARQQAPGAIAASGILGTALGNSTSTLTTYDVRVSGKLADLPGGELGFAGGAEYRAESLNQTADRLSQNATFGFDSATTLDPFNVSRDVKAVFAEVRIPVFGQDQKISGFNLLEVGAAVRKEIYSDTSDPTVPKVSLRWLPIDDQFAIRATYSKSFAAPTLFDLFGPGGVGFTGSLNLQRFGGGPNITGQANARSGANPGLLPSNSKAYTFGAVWSPKAIKGFSVTVDYFNIEQTDLVSSIGVTNILQSVELEGAASPFASFVRQGPVSDNTRFTQGTPITAPGQIGSRPIDESYVTDTLVNISGQKLSGIDFKAQYTYSHDTWGRFDTGASVGYYKSYTIQRLPTTAPVETVGTTIQGTVPRWRSYSFVDWKRGNWGATLAWEFIPSVDDAFADPAETDPASDVHVGSFSSFDTSIRYRFGSENKWLNGFEVRVGANNVLNRQPPLAPSTFTSDNADTATYGAIGRLIFIEARYRF